MTATADRLLANARRAAFNVDAARGTERWITVRGDSMRPLIDLDTALLVRFGAMPRLGQIAVFADGERLVAHRVVAEQSRRYPEHIVAKGDAEPACDPPTPRTEVLGTVLALRRAGRVTRAGCDGHLARLIARSSRASSHATLLTGRAIGWLPQPLARLTVRAVSTLAQLPALTLAILARFGPTIESTPKGGDSHGEV